MSHGVAFPENAQGDFLADPVIQNVLRNEPADRQGFSWVIFKELGYLVVFSSAEVLPCALLIVSRHKERVNYGVHNTDDGLV